MSEEDKCTDADAYDNISLKKESPEEAYRTINDANTIQELNTTQVNIDPEAGEELPQFPWPR